MLEDLLYISIVIPNRELIETMDFSNNKIIAFCAKVEVNHNYEQSIVKNYFNQFNFTQTQLSLRI